MFWHRKRNKLEEMAKVENKKAQEKIKKLNKVIKQKDVTVRIARAVGGYK